MRNRAVVADAHLPVFTLARILGDALEHGSARASLGFEVGP